MRIAICTDQYLPLLSGVADSIDILAAELRRKGHTVRIYTLSLPGAMTENDVVRFRTYTFPGSGNGLAVVLPFGAMADIRSFRPDVIHTHTCGLVGLFALYASGKLRIPLVGTDHTLPAHYLHYVHLDYRPFRFLVKRFSSWYYNRCAFVTAPSRTMLTELTDYGMHRPMEVVSNHIPSDIFRPLARKDSLKEGFTITGKAILVFGRIAVEKNLDPILEIYQDVVRTVGAELVFVGDGPYRKTLERKAKGIGSDKPPLFLGILRGSRLVEAVNACDVFLITSPSETQSMTMLQAMACGLPVVAAHAGGLPEYVAEGKTGYLVAPGDLKAFSDRIRSILLDEDAARAIGEEGRKSVIPYSPERIADQFLAIYRMVLRKEA